MSIKNTSTIGQAVNPYLPENEYIPDGEPRVFEDRVYVYGSHDRFGAPIFCMNDYVCYSAPIDDLSDWRYEGVIFKKTQDPSNKRGRQYLFAPDVVQGVDGKYYMYYGLGFCGVLGVAVCDTPAGAYQYLGNVVHEDGVKWGRRKGDAFCFDPGVLVDEDGRIYLFSGFYTRIPAIRTGMKRLQYDGCYVVELEQDMVTMKGEPKLLLAKEGEGSFPGHEFFEASSIRKYDGRYYFVYSSRLNHELCYVIGENPMGPYCYGGTLISNGDIGIHGFHNEKHAANYTGNNHGGMLKLGTQYYTFYHRQTNRHSYSRQTCAEKLTMRSDGSFHQVEMTSCGLNDGPLTGEGKYEACIACNLWSKQGTGRYDKSFGKLRYRKHPYITQDGKDIEAEANPHTTNQHNVKETYQYIANMRDGAVAGFKYFDLTGLARIKVQLRGKAKGEFMVYSDCEDGKLIAQIPIDSEMKERKAKKEWTEFQAKANEISGVNALYFQYLGEGKVDFLSFELIR